MPLAANTLNYYKVQGIYSDATGTAGDLVPTVQNGFASINIGTVPDNGKFRIGEGSDAIHTSTTDATFIAGWSDLSDWRIEVSVFMRLRANLPVIYAFVDSAGANYVEILSGGAIRLAIRGVNYETGTGIITDGGTFECVFAYDGTDITIDVDGSNKLTTTANGSTGTISKLFLQRWTSAIGIFLRGNTSHWRFKNSHAGPNPSVDPEPVLTPSVISDTQINVSWTDELDGVRYIFYINTADDSGTATPAAWADQGTQLASLLGLDPSTTYYIFMKVVRDNTTGPFGISVNATTNAAGAADPPAPTGLTVTSQNDTDVVLSWTAAAGATSYNIQRAEISSASVTGPYVKINDAVVATTSYTDNVANSTPDPVTGKSYAYQVTGVN